MNKNLLVLILAVLLSAPSWADEVKHCADKPEEIAVANSEQEGTAVKGEAGVLWIHSRPAGLSFTQTEATVGQFKACVQAGGCSKNNHRLNSESQWCNLGNSDREDHPMNCVDWQGATEFCEWIGGRLPSRDEWTAEASNNNKSLFPWGGAGGWKGAGCSQAVVQNRNGESGCEKDRTWPVCTKKAGKSVSGLCDMIGNVWEWTSTPSKAGSCRLVQGGSWSDPLVNSWHWADWHPAKRFDNVGIRCVRGQSRAKPDPKIGQKDKSECRSNHHKKPSVSASNQGDTTETPGADVQWVFSKPAGLSFTKTEVTVGQYKACVQAKVCSDKIDKFILYRHEYDYCNWGYQGREDHPMNCVDWQNAKEFCKWAGGRLPTEAEWYAEASNGGETAYPWGDEPKTGCSHAVRSEEDAESCCWGCGKDRTWPVCSRESGNSTSGLCDMIGNVWEWTSNQVGASKVTRGGAFGNSFSFNLRASSRHWNHPERGEPNIGVRCVREPSP